MQKKGIINIKSDRKYVNILGINILSTNKEDLLTAISKKISSSNKFSILTPNPELVLASTEYKELKEALNSATFAVPDGIGLAQAAKFLSFKDKNPFTIFFQGLFVGAITIFNKEYLTSCLPIHKGRELFLDLVALAEKNNWKIFLLGGLEKEGVLTGEYLISKYPNISISTSKGFVLNKNGEPDIKVDIKIYSDVLERINIIKPDLLFVAFGNPKQEIWIHNNLSKLKVGGVMAVGGTFRYLSGLSPLPPAWMEQMGLEWLWRLVTEPDRIKRIWNAVVIFPLKVFLSKYYSDKKSSSKESLK